LRKSIAGQPASHQGLRSIADRVGSHQITATPVGAGYAGDPAAAGKLAASLLSPLKRLPQSAIRSQLANRATVGD